MSRIALVGGANLVCDEASALGRPCLLEVELTEPSLFFDYAPGSADRLVAALLESLAAAEL